MIVIHDWDGPVKRGFAVFENFDAIHGLIKTMNLRLVFTAFLVDLRPCYMEHKPARSYCAVRHH